MKVLCVAEKPSISKAVATHLAGGRVETHNTRNKYIKNYGFDFDFGQQLGQCSVTMTCVTGHLTSVDFTPANKNWYSPPPESLFSAPIVTNISEVKLLVFLRHYPSLTT
ncbi:DNA topoisomerase [Fusarium irregulare]|uniref:DNA topoisomerase n=1 Tax=Fusarium irregulare TaxID=2494466 RepID=A0A9W8PN41_9HYPO|nr:DNA topoisomerase [Fusarium irregulare]